MLRKIFLISLVLILPVQAWAGLDMSFKHQAVMAGVAAQEISHNCHQDVSTSNEEGVKLSAQSEGNGCNSCALCIGVGFIPTHSRFNQITFTAIFNSGKASFASRDVSALIKPPIL
jgi:hypothetical protein